MEFHPPSVFGILLILSSVEGVKGIEESRVPYAFLEHTWVTVMNRRRIRTNLNFTKLYHHSRDGQGKVI